MRPWQKSVRASQVAAFLPVYSALRMEANIRMRLLCRQRRALVLSYDDGPGLEMWKPLRELLRKYEARATFFLLGHRAEVHMRAVESLSEEGHEVGAHTFHHLHPWKVSDAEAVGDIERGFSFLERWLHPKCLFRPPHGKLTWATWSALRKRKACVCWWTHDSGDTWRTLPKDGQVIDAVRRNRGGVVLMHDFDRGPLRQAFVLNVTEGLLQMAREERLTVTLMSQLLSVPPTSSP